MKLTIVAGARPNFMKIAPIIHELENKIKEVEFISYRLVHTGQHYDAKLSQTFFDQLNIPTPHINLEIGSGSQSIQTANIMIAFEAELLSNPADYVIVVGDVNSTMACAIVAKKMNTKVIHVEGGIRSFDLKMPEEINRMITDSITDYFYVTSKTAINNLLNIGVKEERIVFVGNTMIDTLKANINKFTPPIEFFNLNLSKGKYFILTIHRPSNVDDIGIFKKVLTQIIESSDGCPIIFPVHPRTKKILQEFDNSFKNLHFIDPLGYLEFNFLVKNSLCVITDSGGVTEETTYLNIPCITLRDNTERPETITEGTNELVGRSPDKIKVALEKILTGNWKKGRVPEKWDGYTSKRIVEHLLSIHNI